MSHKDDQKPAPFGTYLGKTPKQEPPKQPVQSPITEEAFSQRSPVFNPLGRVEHINHDEVRIADVRRHFFGLFLIYLQTVVALVLSVGLIIFLLPGAFGENNATVDSIVWFSALIVATLGLIFLALATKIYNSNQLIITDINITQVLQVGLFSRKVSELTMENVEDVTAEQHGIFPTIFNFGTLKVETAGEQNNFIFKYCPNPNAYAKALQDARAAYFKKHSGYYRQPSNI